ncbi:uncharacterized protein Dwil_GK10296 [Drosophila willistoni]|uniref:BED-type domain-containing protein n=1 Tax=Drosophila willistoni TaxID=7260 RepID=B4MJ56_DROWI|nr:uncharacterized protein LOC6638041 [Drosophila willistoni]EDW72145.2 uncharacterized protein Dwil_GK10296 [Drosophila willistoni]
MSNQKYINPVSEHFIYNDETRKSKCKQCHFNMAGRHSENLMRHLKRKHQIVYDEVMRQKRLRRDRLAVSQSRGPSPALSPKLIVKLDPTNVIATESAEGKDNHDKAKDADSYDTRALVTHPDDIASSSQPSKDHFEKIFIGKTEMPDIDEDKIENHQVHLNSETARNSFLGIPNQVHGNSHYNQVPAALQILLKHPQTMETPAASSSSLASLIPATNAQSLAGNDDDAYFLQYLGNKFSKYSTRTKNIIQFQINRILYKADMGDFDNLDSSKISEIHFT